MIDEVRDYKAYTKQYMVIMDYVLLSPLHCIQWLVLF